MFLVLFALWLIFSGKITLEIVIFGIVISAAVTLFCWKFLEYSLKRDLMALKLLPQGIRYFFVLVIEIIKACASMIALIFSAKYEPEPVLITIKTDLRTGLARTVLANSITMTPGTITVELEDNVLKIHCIDKQMAEGIDNSIFVKILRKMEKTAGK